MTRIRVSCCLVVSSLLESTLCWSCLHTTVTQSTNWHQLVDWVTVAFLFRQPIHFSAFSFSFSFSIKNRHSNNMENSQRRNGIPTIPNESASFVVAVFIAELITEQRAKASPYSPNKVFNKKQKTSAQQPKTLQQIISQTLENQKYQFYSTIVIVHPSSTIKSQDNSQGLQSGRKVNTALHISMILRVIVERIMCRWRANKRED